MSRSPKYTAAYLPPAWEQDLERERRERERERRRQAEEARRQRRQAERTSVVSGVARLRARVEAGAADAAATGLGDRQRALLAQIAALSAGAGAMATDPDVRAARDRLAELRREADAVAVAVAGVLAARERERALAALRASLADEPDRAELDAGGAREAGRLLAEAERLLADQGAFSAVHSRLAASVQAHLTRVRARRAELERMRRDAAAARADVQAVLDEARAAGMDLDGAAAAAGLIARLAAAAEAGEAPLASSLSAEARQAGQDLAADFDLRLDRLERAKRVFQAVAAALPEAGLRPVAGSLAKHGDGVRVRVTQADGAPMDIAVVPDSEGVQIEYHADGSDFVITETPTGTAAECPRTEDQIERFRAALKGRGVATGELRWDGKPDTRPDEREARQHWQPDAATRERG